MKTFLQVVSIALLCQSINVALVSGQTCTKWFEPEDQSGNPINEGAWQYGPHWRPDGAPESGDVACVENDQSTGRTASISPGYCASGPDIGQICVDDTECSASTCSLQSQIVAVSAFKVENLSRINGAKDTELTVAGDSTLDGTLFLKEGSILKIDGTVTITGNGGELHGCWDPGADPQPIVRIEGKSPSGDKLIIQGADNSDVTTSLLLDEVFIIDVALENNAYVWANVIHVGPNGEGQTILQGGKKSGTGFWRSAPRLTRGPAPLVINCEIELNQAEFHVGGQSSSAVWQTWNQGELRVDPSASFTYQSSSADDIKLEGGLLVMNHPATEPWNFDISGGTLKATANVKSTGDLLMTGGIIVVVTGTLAEFDVAP